MHAEARAVVVDMEVRIVWICGKDRMGIELP